MAKHRLKLQSNCSEKVQLRLISPERTYGCAEHQERCENMGSTSFETKLNSLELVYFTHAYPTDDQNRRLSRLEKLVFGAADSGDQDTRLSKLNVAITSARSFHPSPSNPTSSAESRQPTDDTDLSKSDRSKPIAKSGSADSTKVAASQLSEEQKSTFSSYPRVTELEDVVLGCAHTQESVVQRLSRLEQKAFGRESSSADLSSRTEALQRYAHIADDANDNYMQLAEARVPACSSLNGYSMPRFTLLQKAEKLEKDEVVQTHPGKALTDRVDT